MVDTYAMLEARWEEERRSCPQPIERDDLPVDYEAITPAWLTRVLCAGHPGAEITKVTLGPTDEGTSSRRRLHLEYNPAGRATGLPATVFCKSTHTLKSRFQLALNGFVEGEVRFYNHIQPVLGIESPRPLFANFDPHTFNSIVILEDMGDAVTFCRHDEPMSRARAESQVRLLAKMHAKYHGSDELTRAFPYLRTWLDTFTATAENGFEDAGARGFGMAESVIPPRLFAREAEVWPATVASAARHEHLPHSVIHSDVHLKNWYIAASGEMGLNDWQCSCKGHLSRDLSYCISASLTVEQRRAWEHDLVAYYVEQMREKGVANIDFDSVWLAYRAQMFGALAWWTGTLGQPPEAPAMQPRDASLAFIERMTHAIDDLDSLGAVGEYA